MAKTTTTKKVKKTEIQPKAYEFLKQYINNPSPVGFETIM
jgi:hypothetical protein